MRLRNLVLAASLLLGIATVALADTGYCPAPYCGTGRPDPWPGDVPLPNEQLLTAYIARYSCPVGVQPCRPGYSAELFGVNYTILEAQCRAGQIPLAAFSEPSSPATFAARLRASIEEVQALPAAYLDGLRALDQDAAAGRVDESAYARRRAALQGLIPRSKSSSRNCLATTTEATDASFAISRQSPVACQWWFLPNWPNSTQAGATSDKVVRSDKPPGAYSDRHPQHGCTWWHWNTCGNHVVDPGETTANCPADVAPPAPRCGDGHADPGETCSSCPADLGPCPPPPPPPDLALHLGVGGRFLVEAVWTKPGGQAGPAKPLPVKRDGGTFTFFDPERPELYVNVLDGCAINGRWWVFSAGLTNVGVGLVVTDSRTGAVWRHASPVGSTYATTLDTVAFLCQ